MTASNQILPVNAGILQYNNGLFGSMPYNYAAGQNAVHGYYSGSMQIVNQGGSRGYEVKVPFTGSYQIDWDQRCDIGGTAAWTWVEAYVILNGNISGGIYGYSIQSGYAGADTYHTLCIHAVLNLHVGDQVGGYWSSSASGTSTANYLGINNGVLNNFCVVYLGPTLTTAF